MFEIKIPKEITEYKEKIILGLNKRQLVFGIIGVGVGIFTYIYGTKYLGEDITSWLVIFLVIAIFYFGTDINGLPPEKYLMVILKKELLYPSVRVFKREDVEDRNIDIRLRELQERLDKLQGTKKRRNK